MSVFQLSVFAISGENTPSDVVVYFDRTIEGQMKL